jgi:hypothetical protein
MESSILRGLSTKLPEGSKTKAVVLSSFRDNSCICFKRACSVLFQQKIVLHVSSSSSSSSRWKDASARRGTRGKGWWCWSRTRMLVSPKIILLLLRRIIIAGWCCNWSWISTSVSMIVGIIRDDCLRHQWRTIVVIRWW